MCQLGDDVADKGGSVILQFALAEEGQILVYAASVLRTLSEESYTTFVTQILRCLYQWRTKPLDDMRFLWKEDRDV